MSDKPRLVHTKLPKVESRRLGAPPSAERNAAQGAVHEELRRMSETRDRLVAEGAAAETRVAEIESQLAEYRRTGSVEAMEAAHVGALGMRDLSELRLETARKELEAATADLEEFDAQAQVIKPVNGVPVAFVVKGAIDNDIVVNASDILLNHGLYLTVAKAVADKRIRLVSGDVPGHVVQWRGTSPDAESLKAFLDDPDSDGHPEIVVDKLAVSSTPEIDDPVSPIFGSYGQVPEHAQAVARFTEFVDSQNLRDEIIERDHIIAPHAKPETFGGPKGDHTVDANGAWIRPSHIPFLRTILTGSQIRSGQPVSKYEAARGGLIYAAQPVFVTPGMVDALLHTDAPDDVVVNSLRLPHKATFVVPGLQPLIRSHRPFDIPVSLIHDHKDSQDIDTWWAPIVPTWLVGFVVFSNDDGTVADDAVICMLSTFDTVTDPRNGESYSAFPQHQHGEDEAGFIMAGSTYTPNWRASVIAPMIRSLIAAVAIRDPEGYDTPVEPFPTGKPRQFVRTSAFRKRATRGNYVKVRIIDLTPADHAYMGEPTHDPNRSVTPHFRRGHFRRVRRGPRDDWYYTPVWIPPCFVQGRGEARQVQVWKA